jgi:hypothetical protein
MVFETLVNAYLGELLKSLGNFTSPKKNYFRLRVSLKGRLSLRLQISWKSAETLEDRFR